MKRALSIFLCLGVLLCTAGCDRLTERLAQRESTEPDINIDVEATGDTLTTESEADGTPPHVAAKNTAPLSESADIAYDAYTEPVPGGVPAPGGMPASVRFARMPHSTDEYPVLTESGFSATLANPFSTFAADVDTASYANVRRMIRLQQPVNPDAVRVEEMINAFAYHYPTPKGDAPVSISTQVAACPWNEKNRLMRVGLKAQAIQTESLPASNLVFLIDVSGSMSGENKLPLVQRSFALLVDQLTERDRVSIVVYAGSDAVVLSGAYGNEKATILEAIYELEAGGGTNGAAGIHTAYEIAKRYADSNVNSRVILATDGDFNIGASSENDLIHLIEEKRNQGIFLTVLGFGYGNQKDNNLQALADHGNGNATYIDTIHQARGALVEEMGATLHTVAKDVKLQVEFNPATVEAYRLIGYENRRLNTEDFADDTKDGGEMGSGHTVTALYEIVPAGTGTVSGPAPSYQVTATTGSRDYATVHVRYKQPLGDTSTEITHQVPESAFTKKPDMDFQLATAVAAFGQMLSGSKFVGTADERMVLGLLQPLLSEDRDGRIVELCDLVRKSNGLYTLPTDEPQR